MKIKNYKNAFIWIFRFIYYKLLYGNRFNSSIIQAIELLKMEIHSEGKVYLGEKIQNRGPLYFICDKEGIISVGSHTFFNTNCAITSMGKITIGKNCKFGNNLVIVDHDHNYKTHESEFIIGEIKIGNNVWCGANCTILRGSVIGDNCVIAAGSVVKGEIPEGQVYLGIHSKQKGESFDGE